MGVHETVPSSKMERQQNKEIITRGVLKHLQFGKANAIKSHELARLIGIEATATNQQIRKTCKELLIHKNIPIISCTKGFFKAENSEEIHNYILSLSARVNGLQRDISVLTNLHREMRYG